MVKRTAEYYPILDQVVGPRPRLRELLEKDTRVIRSVDALLSTPNENITTILEVTRTLIVQRDGRECDDRRLATEIDAVSCFICDTSLYYQKLDTSRYVRSQL